MLGALQIAMIEAHYQEEAVEEEMSKKGCIVSEEE